MSESDYVSPSNNFLKDALVLNYLRLAVVPFGQRVESDVFKVTRCAFTSRDYFIVLCAI